MFETDWRGNWVLFWCVGPCSAVFKSIFCRRAGYVPFLLFDLRPTMVEVMKSHACTTTLSSPNLAAGHPNPCLRQRLLDTHRQACFSLLWVSQLYQYIINQIVYPTYRIFEFHLYKTLNIDGMPWSPSVYFTCQFLIYYATSDGVFLYLWKIFTSVSVWSVLFSKQSHR